MNIKQTFLDFTKETYPHGTESEIFHLLPNNMETDEFGNLFLQIGENPSTMFTSHLDTASHDKKIVNHVFEGNTIKTDGTSILGADNKASVTIMLYLIENNIPGLYYFFLGEERGCIGSKKVANKHRTEPLPNIKKVVSFDRRGTDSVITFQSGSRCCSEVFGNALSIALNEKSKKEVTINLQFNYQNDPTGVYTDSYQFVSVYPECTNISVGYMNEHTGRETQDILHLEKLCKTVVLIDWEKLPVERNPQVEDKKIWFIDEKYNNHVSFMELDSTGKITEIDFDKERIKKEEETIKHFLESIDVGVKKLKYDGKKLIVEHHAEYGGHETEIPRTEIAEYVEELNFWTKYQKPI